MDEGFVEGTEKFIEGTESSIIETESSIMEIEIFTINSVTNFVKQKSWIFDGAA